jgi:glycerol-3-phosphate acyltransferase PlsX
MDAGVTKTAKHKIVLDVMGADLGPSTIVGGGLMAAERFGEAIHVILVGRRPEIEEALRERKMLPKNISVQHADEEIRMTDAARDSVRVRNSSMAVGLRLVKSGEADAFVSPGNTGAVMANSLLILGRIEGVLRPAITSMFPTSTGRQTIVLDVGANADCKPQHMSQFAVMGSVYASVIFNLEAPRVGLISIGEEQSKGKELIFETYKLLEGSKINFVGNIEGRDILSGTIDVAVVDGFTGNILLKFGESIMPMLVKTMRRQVQTNLFSRVGASLLLPFLRRLKNSLDYAEAGGAPLLGVNGNVIICHGGSNEKAISSAVAVAFEMAEKGVKERIHDDLVTNHFGQTNGTDTKSQDTRDGIIYATSPSDQR